MKFAKKIKSMSQDTLQSVRQAFRGVLKGINSEREIQSVQFEGLESEVIQDAEQYQEFGFTSVAPSGTKAIILPLNGKSSHGVIIATENGSFRIKNLKSGETAIYNESGASITLKQNKIIDIECDELNINTKKYTCHTETHETIASSTIRQSSYGETTLSSYGGMVLKEPSAINLATPSTMIEGGITAGSLGRSVSGHRAIFNMPVLFKYEFDAPDGVFNGISFNYHYHFDSISGDTSKPKQ